VASLKDIRDRIKSVKSIQKVTSAMKMVAAAKVRRAQEKMEQARPYTFALEEVIHHLLPDIDRDILDLLEVRDIKRKAYVIVSADRGLAGAFNANIIKIAEQEIHEFGKENVDIFCIGKKSRDYFKHRDYKIVESHVEFWNELDYDNAMMIGRSIIDHFISGKVDEIHVVYNYFINLAQQEVKSEVLLPLVYDQQDKEIKDKLYEPSKEKLVGSLVPRHLNIQIWKYLLESYASEQAARMMAMENATTNAKDMIKSLTLEFNKARQAAITTEMLEIVSGAEALKE
jgi:F-type H+-transporting ATPase subunit gamma|tara:strand:- start:6382 stop:7236 length:855 start_codon:yes stop_codon:yes gene_type:complete